MYPVVPRTKPASVRAVAVAPESGAPPSEGTRFARPKSRIFALPSFETTMFSGFRSLWTIPASCAWARPAATWHERSRSFFEESGPAARTSRNVRPSTSSMTRTCRGDGEDEEDEDEGNGISSNA
jgi:hypothetical protein